MILGSGKTSLPVRIAFVGDVMLGRLVSRELHGRQPGSFWGDVQPLLRSCDAVIANLECAITRHRRQWTRTPKTFHFGAAPEAVAVLNAGNVRAVSLANNHTLDFETQGLIEMLQLLDSAGIAHAGAGIDEMTAQRPAMLSAGSLKIALFACVDHEKSFAAGPHRPGTAYVDIETAQFPSTADIAGVRNKGADITILSCHFGPNMVFAPSQAIVNYRRAAATRGIDVIYGHSAHLFQGIEQRGHSLILHDTGDFLDDYAVDPTLRNDWSFVFVLEMDKTGLKMLTLVPVFLQFACVRLATETEAVPMFRRMTELSSAFGTRLGQGPKRLELDLRAGPAAKS